MLQPPPEPPEGPDCDRCVSVPTYIKGRLWRCAQCHKAIRKVTDDEEAQEKLCVIYCNNAKSAKSAMVVKTTTVSDANGIVPLDIGPLTKILFKDRELIGFRPDGSRFLLGHMHRGWWVRGALNEDQDGENHEFEIVLEERALFKRLPCNCGVSMGLRSDHEGECQATYLKANRDAQA